MIIEELQLYNFRNFSNLRLSLCPKVNIFLGQNGQGKTNLLEAIYLLAKGSSFRPSQVSTFINKDIHNIHKHALARAKILKENVNNEIKIQLEENHKNIFINNKKMTSKQSYQHIPVVIFSPESLSAIKEGPEERRALIDEWLVVSQIKNAKLINDFKKALRTRNKILRDYKKNLTDKIKTYAILTPLNEIYFPLAAQLTYARIQALKQIMPDLNKAMKFISDSENVEISVDYLMSSEVITEWEYTQIYQAMMQRAKQLLNSELDAGTTLVGPHKHDIKFLMSAHDSRYFCSQGQQSALILSFKMAQIINHYRVYNDYPLLLLDDVLSELDKNKRTRLIEFLKSIDAQIFLTTTDLAFDVKSLSENIFIFTIHQGQVDSLKL